RVRAIDVLRRSRRDADRHRRSDAGDLRLQVAVAVEYLNPVVAGVGDVDVPLGVEHDAVDRVELARLAAAGSPRFDEVAVLVQLRDPRIAGRLARAVRDVDVAGPIPRDIRGPVEAVAGDS